MDLRLFRMPSVPSSAEARLRLFDPVVASFVGTFTDNSASGGACGLSIRNEQGCAAAPGGLPPADQLLLARCCLHNLFAEGSVLVRLPIFRLI